MQTVFLVGSSTSRQVTDDSTFYVTAAGLECWQHLSICHMCSRYAGSWVLQRPVHSLSLGWPACVAYLTMLVAAALVRTRAYGGG